MVGRARWKPFLLGFVTWMLPLAGSYAASVSFEPQELFQIPFGKAREMLGSSVQDGNFLFPRDFSMDSAGRFYIYDTQKHRIARFSPVGAFEMDFRYLASADQVFAHADAASNLWILVTEPQQGMFYGIYDPRGKQLRAGIFSRYNQFRLHVDDDYMLRVLLSSKKDPLAVQTYILDEEHLIMKKDAIARPPENHHQIRKENRTFYIDPVPNASKTDAGRVSRITDESRKSVADIQGSVVYVTAEGDVYTQVGKRDIRIYDVKGRVKGQLRLKGLSAACDAIRFDAEGNIYELDGIPDLTDEDLQGPHTQDGRDFEDRHYTSKISGMRMIVWKRR